MTKDVKAKEFLGVELNEENGPRTRSYSGRTVTDAGQRPTSIKAGIDQIMGRGRSNGYAKKGDCSGVAHNKEPQNIKFDELVLAAVRRSKQKLGMEDAKAEEFLVSCVCGSIQFAKTLNFLKCVQCKDCSGVTHKELQNKCTEDAKTRGFLGVQYKESPKTRSYSERSEQMSLSQCPQHSKVKDCDKAAKVEDCPGVTHNQEPQNTCTADRSSKNDMTKEFLGIELNNESGPKTRSYSERFEQRSLSLSPQHIMVKGCGGSAKECAIAADRSNKFPKDSSSFTTDDVDILIWILHSSGRKDFSPSSRPRTMIPTQLFNYQGVLNRFIEDIDIPKQTLYSSGFILSCKDFSPGSDSLLSSIATYLSCKDFFPGFLPLSSSTTGLQFYTNPTRLSPTLSTLLPNYQGSLNRTIDVLDILKWILYFSGFNLIGENVSPVSAFLFSSAAAHKCYTSSTSGFNLSCKDFSPGFLSPSPTTTVHQLYTNPKWILHPSGFKFSYKDFSPSARPMIPTPLFNYQGVLNCSIEDIDIPKQTLYLSGLNMRCKDFSPGFLPLSSPTTGLQLYTSAAVHKCYTSSISGFNLSCKDFSFGFFSLSSPTTVHQFYTNPTRRCPTLLTLLTNYQISYSYTTDDVDILKWILYSNGFKFNYKDFSPSARPRTMTLYLSGFNMSC